MLRKIRRNGDNRGEVHVAAFGKHPAWPDHLPDQGVASESLVQVKRELYLEGIGGNITAGTWESEEPDHFFPEFNHVFCRMDRQRWTLGRFWSSVDLKGRARYPMVVCVECPEIPSRSFAVAAYGCLEKLERACRAAETEAAVIGSVDVARADLRAREVAPSDGDEPSPVADPLARLATRPEFGDERIGLLRVLYYIERDLAGYRLVKGSASRSSVSSPKALPSRAGHIRAPRCAETPIDAIGLWTGFLRDQFVAVPSWLFVPIDHDWVDLLIGTTTKRNFACIRTTPAENPLVTDVPYQLDDEFVARSQQAIGLVD